MITNGRSTKIKPNKKIYVSGFLADYVFSDEFLLILFELIVEERGNEPLKSNRHHATSKWVAILVWVSAGGWSDDNESSKIFDETPLLRRLRDNHL